jgi:hypothetical protein
MPGGRSTVEVATFDSKYYKTACKITLLVTLWPKVRLVHGCRTDLSIDVRYDFPTTDRESFVKPLAIKGDASSHQSSRNRLRVDVPGFRSVTLARLGAFAFAPHSLTWTQFNVTRVHTAPKTGKKYTAYMYEADHVGSPQLGGKKDPSSAVSSELRVLLRNENNPAQDGGSE